MTKSVKSLLFLLTGILILFSACRDITNNPIYQKPDWLDGKLFTQIKAEDNLKTFTALIEPTEWASILDRSGFFTVFAPTDEAFELFFQNNPQYNSIEDFDSLTRDNIIRYHIIDDGWSREQLRSLNESGFIQEGDRFFSQPRAFKRQTLFRDQIKTVYAIPDLYQEEIVRTNQPGTSIRKVIPDTRKYVPIFFKEYFNIYKYTPEDYAFYFNREFNTADIYYANARLVGEDIFAENGFIHTIDQVVMPLPNLEQVLLKEYEGRSYTDFIDLMYEFPSFFYNDQATKAQPGYDEGLSVDDLFEVNYPRYLIDIDREETGFAIASLNTSLISHPTLLAPTNSALKKLIDETITKASGFPRYNSFDQVPDEIKWLIVNSYMTRSITYEKEFSRGFLNGQNDSVIIDINDVADRQFCSNGVFIGLNEPIIPRAFTAVSGPIYLRPGYSAFRLAMIQSGLLSQIKRDDKTFTLFALSDATLQNDSSLMIEEEIINNRVVQRLIGYDQSIIPLEAGYFGWNSGTLSTRLMNQICEGEIEGFAKREFLRTLSGNYITFDNQNNMVQGSTNSVFGFNGDSAILVTPVQFPEPTDNGTVFEVDGWNSFGASPSLFNRIQRIGSVFNPSVGLDNYFMYLCKRAGLANDQGFNTNMISVNDFYTVFVPNQGALEAYEQSKNIKLDQINVEELKKFLQYHFIKGHLIFTDGKKPSGNYETLRLDEVLSNSFNVYSSLNLELDYDNISVIDKGGNEVLNLTPEMNTNIFAYTTFTDPNAAGVTTVFTSAVVHEISTVLVYEN